jgi:hypothetical protein
MASRKKKVMLGCLVVFGIPLIYLLSLYGPPFRDFWKKGIIQAAIAPSVERAYEGDSAENLRALYTALKLYHDSEEHFPQADGWMDAIAGRIRTTDMPEEEALKKFVRPDLTDEPDQYGYALNEEVAGMYIDDIDDPAIPLLFESKVTDRNAGGDPDEIGLTSPPRGISVDGRLLNF